jgi:hypothetical protein
MRKIVHCNLMSDLRFFDIVIRYVIIGLHMLVEAAMPIDLTDKIVALFAALSNDDIDALPPVQRRRLAEQCGRVADRAEADARQPRAGVLGDLKRGVRSD